MKKIYLFILFLIALTSCDVLEQEPQEEISDQIAFNNAKSAEAAMAGVYSQLQKAEYYGRNFQLLIDCSSDISQSIGTWDFYREVDTYSIDASNLEIKNFYEIAYMGVNQANNIIANVPNITDLSEAKKSNFLGQAYFLRGLIFFDLARTFGGVPGEAGSNGIGLPLTPSTKIEEASFISRATLAGSYAQVRQDLETALTLLPAAQGNDGESRARAVKGTARALLARLHLYLKEYDLAISYATEVIDDPRYVLNPSFTDIFNGKLTTESIFELEFNSADQSGLRNWYLPASLSGRGDIAAHGDLVTEMKSNASDVRGTVFGSVLNSDNSVSHFYPTKYQKAGNIDNVHIIRISEMYLIRAEARAIKGDAGAESDLNEVRNRAGLNDYSFATDGDLILAIEKENKFEFAFEGHRWFDLVRTGRALTVLASVNRKNSSVPVALTNPDHLVLPIPRDETLSNPNIKQNDGYGN